MKQPLRVVIAWLSLASFLGFGMEEEGRGGGEEEKKEKREAIVLWTLTRSPLKTFPASLRNVYEFETMVVPNVEVDLEGNLCLGQSRASPSREQG
ncbi:hypothetical protein Tco_0215352 [Tanacetum coccineum]